jgi:hypothetical protein
LESKLLLYQIIIQHNFRTIPLQNLQFSTPKNIFKKNMSRVENFPRKIMAEKLPHFIVFIF